MKNQRLRLLAVMTLLGVGFASASCGSSTKRNVPQPEDAGAAGEGPPAAGSSGNAGEGTAGGNDAGASGDGGAAGEGGEGGVGGSMDAGAGGVSGGGASGASSGGVGGVSGSGGVGGVSGSGGASGGAGAPPDVGVGCIAPPSQAPLSPSAAGLSASGLQLWLRADRGVYATEAQRVCAWADQSGNGHLLLSNGETRPLFASTGLGGQAAIDFDVANARLAVPNVLGIPATSARTMAAVVRMVDLDARFAAITQGQPGTPGTYLGLDTNTFQTAGKKEGVYVHNNSYDASLATTTDARVYVFTVNTMTIGTPVLPNIAYYINGGAQTLTRRPGGLGNGNFESFAGANWTYVGNNAGAVVAELILYDRVLTSQERIALEVALEARYAIE